MHAAPCLLSFLLILLYHSGWTYGLCKLENSTVASCHELKDIKYIETHDLEYLKAPIAKEILMPGFLSDLDNLRHLDLSGGDLRKIEPGSFRTLSNLRSLDLGDNRLEYLELASLDGLAHLRSLNLRENAIRQLPPALARLKKLRHLDIHGNPLECNCATLKVRDLIAQRGVTVSKKIMCAGPGNTKGTALVSPSAAVVCSLEQQDREMQNDQADGSGAGLDSGDILDELSEEEEEEEEEEKEEENEYAKVHGSSSPEPSEAEVETPFPAPDSTTVHLVTTESTSEVAEGITSTTVPLQRTAGDEEIFFDGEEKKEHSSTTEMSRRKEDFKDALFYPVSGSGDGEEASGEGSGTGWTHFDEERLGNDDATEEPTLFDMFWDSFFGTTATPPGSKDPDLEEEQFIDASSTEEPSHSVDASKVTTETKVTSRMNANGVEVIKPDASDESKSSNVKAADSTNDELAEMSSKQSKKGMGSYVVLGALLAVLVALIVCAAYKGNCCKKKRKQDDVETGTELKDVRKSLIPDGENTTQAKIASNGNAENVSLMEGNSEHDYDPARIVYNGALYPPDPSAYPPDPSTYPRPDAHLSNFGKPPENSQDEQPVKERPRVDVNTLRENFLADRTVPAQTIATSNGPTSPTSEPNGPPLSPGAQRVKITLQEIPDSVPKTPILITRTMAGENLVKTP